LASVLESFHSPVRRWFAQTFGEPTRAQQLGWPPILRGESTLLLAPTGSGKTLAAFLVGLDRILFSPEPEKERRLRLVYVSPLKALGVDVERNLKLPLNGIRAAAARAAVPCRELRLGVRSGDTPSAERARFRRVPPDILITTPESLYLLLTSDARKNLEWVESVIVDEIHSLVGNKRGAHLLLSLERLERLRRSELPLQRIGLSATQRPLEVVARALGGGEPAEQEHGLWTPRPVTIVDAGGPKRLDLRVELPFEIASAEAPISPGAKGNQAWPAIHARLVELVRAHRSTMIFVNNRRLAERLSAAMNELAGEEIAVAHHGSVARDRRREVEERLKRGELPAIVATSSLELGIDMGAVDLVVQIEAPLSVASGLQRIGRAGHSVEGISRGVVVPKHRGDLLASAAVTVRMLGGEVEQTQVPESPLDVLAQQIVAIAAMDTVEVEALYRALRCAAPFAKLPRSAFDGVLDLLSGRYPSDEFAELRPRIVWDRVQGKIRGRQNARRVAVISGGTIPDRGLYGVFLLDSEARGSVRVGELDEEMVFETRVGDVFVLGASSWRVERITHDRVLVSPAPGEPGKMPFWHGDRPGRPAELGRAIGALTREIAGAPREQVIARLVAEHRLAERAAEGLVSYVREQLAATGAVPSDRKIIVERFVDELGDWRICVLSPFGGRVHAPWAMAASAAWRTRSGNELETIWSDDGIVIRFPESNAPPDGSLLALPPENIDQLVAESLGGSSLFAARFRENAARALLLPRRRPGLRSPLWAQRKRAADLLAIAAHYPSFPILIETYRECLRDVFDIPALAELLRQTQRGEVELVTVDTQRPSPFAATLLFSYVGAFIYDGDAPLAERRAHAISIDTAELRQLLGEAELRRLLDPESIRDVESLRRAEARVLGDADALHDALIGLGPLSIEDIRRRSADSAELQGWVAQLVGEARIYALPGERLAAAEDASRLRDALGIEPPRELPPALLERVADPLADLVRRYARTHGPFTIERAASELGAPEVEIAETLFRLAAAGVVVEGEFLPDGHGKEWVDAEVLRQIKQRSLLLLREQVEPVTPAALARFVLEWQGLTDPAGGADALADAIVALQGAPLVASSLETEVLPLRVRRYQPRDLDLACASGAVVWRGLEPIGASDGRIALYPADRYRLLAPPPRRAESALAARIRDHLRLRGASFFTDLSAATGAFSADLLAALWELVWAGEVTNDTLFPLRSLGSSAKRPDRRHPARRRRSSSELGPRSSQGRWSLLPAPGEPGWPSETVRRTALVGALLERHGVLVREAVAAENIVGGFSSVYDVLRAMEAAGKIRRGFFVRGLGPLQFALPGAEDSLRRSRASRGVPEPIVLAATDPANPYGAALPWPGGDGRSGATRSAGALVVLRAGELLGWLGRRERSVVTFLPDSGSERATLARALARGIAERVAKGQRRAVLIETLDGGPAARSPLARWFQEAGFAATARGLLLRASAVTEAESTPRGSE
jgi:ATP-dependent helicase Lhr and Lhr-like helicase